MAGAKDFLDGAVFDIDAARKAKVSANRNMLMRRAIAKIRHAKTLMPKNRR